MSVNLPIEVDEHSGITQLVTEINCGCALAEACAFFAVTIQN